MVQHTRKKLWEKAQREVCWESELPGKERDGNPILIPQIRTFGTQLNDGEEEHSSSGFLLISSRLQALFCQSCEVQAIVTQMIQRGVGRRQIKS